MSAARKRPAASPRVEFVSTRTRIEKLGVRHGSDVLLLGIEEDREFVGELEAAGARIRTAGKGAADMIFATFRHRADLRRLPALVPRLKADGVIWTLRPKGSRISKDEVVVQRLRPETARSM